MIHDYIYNHYIFCNTQGKAHEAGYFKSQIAPIEVKGKKGPESVEVDEVSS